jgi:hypothetical protein
VVGALIPCVWMRVTSVGFLRDGEVGLHKIHNLVWCWRRCNSAKGGRDAQTWYGVERKDEIPRLVQGKFLKLVYRCHECRGTLDSTDLDRDGKLDVMDLGAIFATPCPRDERA